MIPFIENLNRSTVTAYLPGDGVGRCKKRRETRGLRKFWGVIYIVILLVVMESWVYA